MNNPFFSTKSVIVNCYYYFGDDMKKHFVVYLLFAILLGFISAEVVYTDYKNNLEDTEYNAFLIQVGSFDDEDFEVDESNYLVIKENGTNNVYAGITSSLSNASKIKEMLRIKNIDSYIKPVVIDNVEFISNLKQFDILLSEVESPENLISINDVIISKYEEIVLDK